MKELGAAAWHRGAGINSHLCSGFLVKCMGTQRVKASSVLLHLSSQHFSGRGEGEGDASLLLIFPKPWCCRAEPKGQLVQHQQFCAFRNHDSGYSQRLQRGQCVGGINGMVEPVIGLPDPPVIQVRGYWVLPGLCGEVIAGPLIRAALRSSLGWALLLPQRSCGPEQGPTYQTPIIWKQLLILQS